MKLQRPYLIYQIAALLILCSCKKEEPAPPATADFFVGNSGCIAPCWMYFYDNSMNAVKWEWNFDNGFNSTTQNDSMLFNEYGFYDVSLTVWNIDDSSDNVVKTVQVY